MQLCKAFNRVGIRTSGILMLSQDSTDIIYLLRGCMENQPCKDLIDDSRLLLAWDCSVVVNHVARESNYKADRIWQCGHMKWKTISVVFFSSSEFPGGSHCLVCFMLCNVDRLLL